jgi:hypothetical protein
MARKMRDRNGEKADVAGAAFPQPVPACAGLKSDIQ